MADKSDDCSPRFAFYSRTSPTVGASIDYQNLVGSVIDALAAHFERGVLPLSPHEIVSTDIETLEAEIHSCEAKIRDLRGQEESLLGAITSGSLSDHLLRELDARFTRVRSETSRTQSLLDETSLRLETARARSEQLQARRRADRILFFVAALRDCRSSLARQFFTTCISDLEFRIETDSRRRRTVRWTGIIAFSLDAERACIPFHGAEVQRVNAGTGGDWAIQSVLSGRPFMTDYASRALSGGDAIRVRANKILPSLGLSERESWILQVSDSLLLRAYVALFVSHPQRPSWQSLETEILADFGDPERLRERLYAVHARLIPLKMPMWSRIGSRAETESLIKVAQGRVVKHSEIPPFRDGQRKGTAERWATSEGYRSPSPCGNCKSVKRARLVIDEPGGYVCLDCRQDALGITWPRRFDRFIAHPNLWVEAGFDLELPPPEVATRAKRTWSNRRKRLEGLSEQTVSEILRRYQDGAALACLVKEFELRDAHDVYWLLDARAMPRRRHQQPQRRRAS